jgi:hypothetical protein
MLGVRQFGHTKINGVRLFGHPKISDDLSVTKGRFLRVGRPTTFIGARFPHRLTPTLPFGAFVNEEEAGSAHASRCKQVGRPHPP